MTLDHQDFVVRHNSQTDPQARKNVYEAFIYVIGALAFISLTVFFIYLFYTSGVSDMLKGLALISLCTAYLLGYGIFLVLQKRELALVREVIEGGGGARLVTDAKGRTVLSNAAFRNLCAEHSDEKVSGLPCLFHLFEAIPDNAMKFESLKNQARQGLSNVIEICSKMPDNERWFTISIRPLKSHKGFTHWRVDDVTQKHMIDRAIRSEREKLIDFTDNAPVGFFSADEKGRFVFANATFARWVGEDLRSLLDHGVLHTYLVNPPEKARPYDLTEESLARQVAEVRMKSTGGKTFLASINQTVVEEPNGTVRTRAVVHDLTAEREMRRALEDSEDRFQRFFEEAPLGIVQLDNERIVQDCNDSFLQMLNAEHSDLKHSDFKKFLVAEDRHRVIDTLKKIKDGQNVIMPLEVPLVWGNTTTMTQMYARRFSGGKNVVLHFINVTEQKSLEEQFVQSQKMQAIGQLAGGIAHDFNNLLTAIIGFCDLLLLRHKPGDSSFSDIMQIKQNSNRAANLVRQLLAFSRQQTLRTKVQDITDILTELSHLIRRLIGAGIELDLVHGQDLWLVKVDEGQMEQVLINMAVNARDAMGDAGSLVVTTENYTNTKPLELISEELPIGDWVKISVADTGSGITKENLSRIFEPFFTTKEVGHGTGLGLATVYGIIRQSDAYLDVISVVEQGTTFTIYLPRALESDDNETEDPIEDDSARDLTGSECILLVEDEDAVRMFSQRALSNKGYEVLTAESGDAALSILNQHDGQSLDLVITDVVMPGMDGPTLVQRIRQDHPNLKVIFVSGYTEDKLKDHMDDKTWFLPKPFSLKILASKVKEVLED